MAPRKDTTPINQNIKASQVMLIDQDGKKRESYRLMMP